MTARDFQQARSVLPAATVSPLYRSVHLALSCAWAAHPEADADQLLEQALDAMPADLRDQAAPILHRAQVDLSQKQVEQRSATILYH